MYIYIYIYIYLFIYLYIDLFIIIIIIYIYIYILYIHTYICIDVYIDQSRLGAARSRPATRALTRGRDLVLLCICLFWYCCCCILFWGYYLLYVFVVCGRWRAAGTFCCCVYVCFGIVVDVYYVGYFLLYIFIFAGADARQGPFVSLFFGAKPARNTRVRARGHDSQTVIPARRLAARGGGRNLLLGWLLLCMCFVLLMFSETN